MLQFRNLVRLFTNLQLFVFSFSEKFLKIFKITKLQNYKISTLQSCKVTKSLENFDRTREKVRFSAMRPVETIFRNYINYANV